MKFKKFLGLAAVSLGIAFVGVTFQSPANATGGDHTSKPCPTVSSSPSASPSESGEVILYKGKTDGQHSEDKHKKKCHKPCPTASATESTFGKGSKHYPKPCPSSSSPSATPTTTAPTTTPPATTPPTTPATTAPSDEAVVTATATETENVGTNLPLTGPGDGTKLLIGGGALTLVGAVGVAIAVFRRKTKFVA